jgi:hypothetical protein
MRRALVVISAVLLALAGAARAGSENQLRANKAAAQTDARKLLALVQLPKGLERSAARPRVGGMLVGERSANGEYSFGAQAYWTTEADPRSIIAYVKAHRPAGSKIETWGSGGGPDTTSLDVVFSWPAQGTRVYDRALTVSVVSASSGPSAVVAQSQSDWVIPRPRGETVPSAVGSVAITVRMGSGSQGLKQPVHISTYLVWRAARVAAIIDQFNRLPTLQPGNEEVGCPAMFADEPQLTLAFKTGRGGRTLATAKVNVSPGRKGWAGWYSCNPIDFWIAGKQQTALISRTFVKQISQLIGTSIS